MRYHDITVAIRPALAGEGSAPFRVEARSDTFGRGAAAFDLPAGSATDSLRRALEPPVARAGAAAASSGGARHLAPPHAEPPPPPPRTTELGSALFSALFQGDTFRLLERCLAHEEAARAETGEERGLRLRLLFDPADAELPALAAVPWELLYRTDRRRFLARSRHTPIVRTLAVARPAPPLSLPSDRPLRVLLVEATPRDQRRLATEAEADAIEAALATLPGVQVVRASRADLGPLHRDHLRHGGFHAVHFMGHADFDDATGDAALCFERPDGTTRLVPASLFSEHVEDAGTVRLVVLNACSTGALPRRGLDPFTAAATALVIAGTPAVVAMQLPISDRAAIAFATAFYQALAHRERLSAAVAAGRLAICRDDPETIEWATPVLYLRGDDDLLAPPPPSPEGVRAQNPPDRPLRLGIRSLAGLGLDLERKADRPLSLLLHFDGRPIRDDALWHQAVLPELETFLAGAATTGRPLVLDLAAHQSLAVAAGRFLEAKSGVAISVIQRGQSGTHEWPARPGEVPEGPLWQELEIVERDPDSRDVAAAVSVTHDALPGATEYLEDFGLPVRRVLHATVHPAADPGSVRDGAHALRLAQTLARHLRARTPDERRGTLHLFAAAPNALLVFLGQLTPALGPVQLYEYDFPTGPYRPSFRLGDEGPGEL
jgi:hypothetical protein